MQTFQTAAVVGLVDNLSGPLRTLAAAAKAAVKQVEAAQLGQGNANNLVNGMEKANKAAREHINLLGRIRSDLVNIGKLGSMYATFFALPAGARYEKNFDDELNRMRAYQNMSPAFTEALRKQANTEGVKWKGGALGFVEASGAMLRAGLADDDLIKKLGKDYEVFVGRFALLGQQFADLNRVDVSEGMENAFQFMELFRTFKDKETGKLLSVTDYANKYGADDTLLAAKSTMGKYLRAQNLMPGKEKDFFDFMRFAGSTIAASRGSIDEHIAVAAMLATAGITGSRAGVYDRGMIQRGMVPSAIALDAMRSYGISPDEYNKFISFNPQAVQTKGFIDALQTRFGKLQDTRGVAAAIEKIRANGIGSIDEATQMIVEGIMKSGGRKGILKDPMKTSAWVQKQLFLGAEGFSLFDMLKVIGDAKKQDLQNAALVDKDGKLKENAPSVGLTRKVFGIESATAALALLNQDIDEWVNKVKRALSDQANGGMTTSQQWDEAAKVRLESFGSQLDQIGSRGKAAFDEMYRSVEPFVKLMTGGVNTALDKFISAGDAVHQLGVAAGVVAGAFGVISASKFVGGLMKLASGAGTVAGGAVAAEAAAAGGGGAAAAAAGGGVLGWLAGKVGAGSRAALSALGIATEGGIAGGWIGTVLKGSVGAIAGSVSTLLPPIIAAITTGELLHATDPKGTLWGALDGPTEWLKRMTGVDFSKPFGEAFAPPAPKKEEAPGGPSQPDLRVPPWPTTNVPPVQTFDNAAKQVVVEGEGRLDAEVQVKIDPSPYFMSNIDKKIQQATMHLRDKLGTSMGGTSGVNPAPTPPISR